MHDRKTLAFLGLGAMGARMAARLAASNFEVKVWSRSGVKAPPRTGAWMVELTPVGAAQDADVVISMVTDDDASKSLWIDSGVLEAMRPGAVGIECSTVTPGWVRTLSGRAEQSGLGFMDAPVVGSRPQAENGELNFLVGGADATVETCRDVLLIMGKAVHHIGVSGAGATAKLIANALFTTQIAALAELIPFARHSKLDLGCLLQALASLPIASAAAQGAAAAMATGTFAPQFPLSLAAKDLRYVVAAAAHIRTELPLTSKTGELFVAAEEQGLGEENLTALTKLYL